MRIIRLLFLAVYYPVRITEFVVASLILYLILGGLISFVFYRYDVRDSFFHAALWPIANTRWAPGYSELKFGAVKKGMDRDQILVLLGDPLVKHVDSKSEEEYWEYTWRGDVPCCTQYEGNFHRREVRFAKNGKVETARREFDID